MPNWTYNSGSNAYSWASSSLCTQADLQSAINDAASNHPTAIVGVPSGSYVWTCPGLNAAITIDSGITLIGGYGGGASVVLGVGGGGSFGYGVVNIFGAATISSFTFTDSNTSSWGSSFYIIGTSGWRLTNLTYTQDGSNYFVYYNNCYGVIDHCVVNGNGGELIFGQGPSNAWQTPDSPGTANAVYVENCTFSGTGTVSDFNANSRAVVRFCTINGNAMKIDGHGLATNSPARSFREMEVYGNVNHGGSTFMNMRGGTGFVFGNNLQAGGWIDLCDYSYSYGNYVVGQYAIPDQIGTGMDQSGTLSISVAAGSPGVVTTSGPLNMPIGTEFHLQAYSDSGAFDSGSTIAANSTPALSNSNVNDCVVTGTNTFEVYSVNGSNTPSPLTITSPGSGTLTWGPYSGGAHSDPVYAWSNIAYGGPCPISAADEGGYPMTGIINPNRDYYDSATSVGGIPGVVVGPYANIGTGQVVGQGYWATDKGNNWNTKNATVGDPAYGFGNGALYVWTGSIWVPKYTPYTYPFPFGPPVVTPSTAYATVGVDLSYQIVASGYPTGYATVIGMPSWGSLNTTTGVISGTPSNTTGQPFSVVVNATNASGTSSNATITIDVGNAPVITSSSTASGQVGQSFSYTITASNTPTGFYATGSLPPGLTISGAVISGTPTTANTYDITVYATNNFGTGNQGVAITISPPTITAVTITGPSAFTGEALTPLYTTTPSGGTVAFTPTTEVGPGTYTMAWSGTGIYSGSGTTPWTISPSVAIDVTGNFTTD